MPKLEVHLKQHTPILQFHAEPGAGLRGTELKPALDRFLLQQCPGVKRWEIKNDDDRVHALEYRVKIVDTADELRTDRNKMQQIGAVLIVSKKNGLAGVDHKAMMGSGANVTFLSAHAELLACIREWIGPFFACNNFGYQKNKGFGCYSVEKIEQELYQTTVIQDLRKALREDKIYEVTPANLNGVNNWQDALLCAAKVRKEMKTGIRLKQSAGEERVESPFMFKSVKQGGSWRTFLISRSIGNVVFETGVCFLSECIPFRGSLNRWLTFDDEQAYTDAIQDFLTLLTTFKSPQPRRDSKGREIAPSRNYPLLKEVK